MNMENLIKLEKDHLRRKYKSIRLSEKNLKSTKDKMILERLIASKEYKMSKLILTYVSKIDEIDTFGLISKAIYDKKILAVPCCIKEENKIEFFRINSLSDLKLGSFNIMEPMLCRCEPILNFNSALCIVPGLCFDEQRFRLGYGGGYYDKFLSSFDGKSVGLCYENCISDTYLPINKFDQNVDMVITENRVIV